MSNNDKNVRGSLDLIQQLTVDHLIKRFEDGDITPQELNIARTLLKDNHVIVSPEKADDMGTLSALLPEFGEEDGDDEPVYN
jgi:hypothetical protein